MDIKKLFPNLVKEIKSGIGTVKIDGIRTKEEFEDESGIINFIRRCEKEEEALEIIEYMEKRGEISEDYAKELREQLLIYGLRSFGAKKERRFSINP